MTTHAFAPRFDLSNVFLPARETLGVSQAIPQGRDSESSFALVKSGPAVSADEVESHVDAVEVTVRWGTQVLSVKHLSSGTSFYVGDDSDLALPEDVLGATRAPIVVSRGAGTYVVVPRGARGHFSMKDGETQSFDSASAQSTMHASAELPGATELPLAHGMSVTLEVGAERADGTMGEPITFEIGTVRAGKVAPIGFLAALAGGATGFVGLSFLGHAAIVASLAMFMPKMSTDDSDAIDRDQMMLMQKFLSASAEREAEQQPKETGGEAAGGGSTGERHEGAEGAAGVNKVVAKPGHIAVKGSDNTSSLSKKEELKLAQNFGMAGILASSMPFDADAPTSPWAKDLPKGSSVKSAMGDMFSTDIGDAMGTGLGLSGNGEGGGGFGQGVGLDHVNTLGGGGGGTGPSGFGPGDKSGMGIGHGPGGGGHVATAPRLRPPPTIETNGRLPAEVIQRIVRQNFGRFRVCYEAGLRSNPSLSGRIATKFVIGRDGAVMQSSDAGSDLPDQNVVACVVRSFNSLSFPKPEGGIATVTYPIMLSPGE
jgi:hypothetical protein